MPAVVSAFFVLVSLAGQGQQGASAAGSAPSPADVVLRPRFVPGRVLTYKVTENQSIADEAEGVEPIVTRTVTRFRIAPVAAAESGVRLRVRIERIEWTVDGPGNPVSFDSDLPRQRRESKELSSFRDIVDRDFDVHLDKEGAISSIGDPTSGAARNNESRTADGLIRKLMAMQTSWAPRQPVTLGSNWQKEETLPIGLVEVVRKNHLRVTRLDHSAALLEGRIEISGRASEGIVQDGERLVASVVASRPGECRILFDRANECVQRIDSGVLFQMRVHRVPLDKGLTATTSSQKLSAATTVELENVGRVRLAN